MAKRELIDGEEMLLRGAITDNCAKCPNTSFHGVVPIGDKEIPPPMAMMGAGNLDVVVFERIIPRQVSEEVDGKVVETSVKDRFYVFFRCEAPMCLLGHLRETMMTNWLNQEQERMQVAHDQLRTAAKATHHKRRGRKANKRVIARAKAAAAKEAKNAESTPTEHTQ